ncbi:MAG: SDR family oxidoreductase [Pseudomonadota bacterium]
MKVVSGKKAVITGAAMGMGKHLAAHFARDGADLILVDIQEEKLEQTAAELRRMGSGKVHTYVCDLAHRKDIYEMAERVREEVGLVDIIVNNAGVVFGGEFLNVDDAKHQKCIDINLGAVMWVTKAFLPYIIAKREGHIVNMSSAAGLVGVPDLAVYSATKFAVIGFTESLREEIRRMGLSDVKLTTVCPSYVATGMFEGVKPPKLTRFLSPRGMARKIYEAMKNDEQIVMEPFMVKLTPLLKAMLPPDVLSLVSRLLGVGSSMKKWRGHQG